MKAPIKLIKWGIIFFSESAEIIFDRTNVQVLKRDGTIVLDCAPGDLKKANYNSTNGIITLRASNGQKCNLAFLDAEPAAQFGQLLDSFEVKGLNI